MVRPTCIERVKDAVASMLYLSIDGGGGEDNTRSRAPDLINESHQFSMDFFSSS